ncbi:MAG: hypothetical protein ACJ711_03070 [Ornithinibacter sp.]
MTAARLILLLLLVLVVVVIVVVVLRRGSARRDAHRVEAANLRSEAETLAAGLAGQSAFADQAAERAEVARLEAEERAREAARLEAEAAEHRAAVEATQRDYEATMRRADDIDPDVKESQYPAVTEAADGRTGAGATHPDAGTDDRGGAAAGASAWAARGDDDRHGGADQHGDNDHANSDDRGDNDRQGGEESERIASAAGFRDDVPAEPTEVYAAHDRGSEPDMSDNSSTETTHPGDDEGLGAGGATVAASAGGGGAYAATRAMQHDDDGEGARTSTDDTTTTTTDDTTGGRDRSDTDVTDGTDVDRAAGTDRPAGGGGESHGAATDGGDGVTRPEGDPAEMTIIGEPEAYATTEPVMASEQTAPISPEQADAGVPPRTGDADASRESGSSDERNDIAASADHAPAEAGAAVAETDGTDRSAADVAEQPTQERYDPTPTRDWAADEGELLEENSDRGDRLEAERNELAHEDGDANRPTATDQGDLGTASGDGTASGRAGTTAPGDAGTPASAARRVSAFEEIRDGGFGVGSAAPLDGGAQPLDHPVQGYRDMTYRAPGDRGYDAGEPDVWFYDEGAAQRSGFRRADG